VDNLGILEILVQLLHYSPALVPILLVIYFMIHWKRIKPFISEFKTFLMQYVYNLCYIRKINSAMQSAFYACKHEEPLLRAFKYVIPLQLKIESDAKDVEIRLETGRVLGIIPSKSMSQIVKAIDAHFADNISQFSVVKDFSKLERALELVCLELVMRNCKIDGGLAIAASRFINKAKENEEINLMFSILSDLNGKLKQTGSILDRRLLRILIVETCRGEFDAIGKVFV